MKKILSILILVSCFFASKAQVPMLSSDYLFKNRVSVGAQSLTGTPTSVWFKIGDSASNKGFITPTVKHLDSVPYPRYRGLQVWDLDTGMPYWWDGDSWIGGGGSEETVLFLNGLPTSKDTILRWVGSDTLVFKTFKPGWGLIQSTTTGVYTDTTWGTDLDSVKVKAWILTFVQEADSTAILVNASGGGYELVNFQTLDTVKVKNLLPGTNVTFDSTATGITINASGTVTAADNGLSLSSATVKLGGGLDETTTVDLADQSLYIKSDTASVVPSWGMHLYNSEAATVGSQRATPPVYWDMFGWKTTATAASQLTQIRNFANSVQGTTSPTAQMVWQRANNGGSWQDWISFTDQGVQIVGTNGSGDGGLSLSGTAPQAARILSNTTLDFAMTGTTAQQQFSMRQGAQAHSVSGTDYTLRMWSSSTGFAPTSGSVPYTMLSLEPLINQVGSTGISRALHISPTLTAAADFRAIDIENGRSLFKGVAYGFASAPNSADYTVGNNDYIIELADLSGANRNVVLPSSGVAGRTLRISNLSSDGTFKWSFSGGSATDITGAAVTTLTDQKIYEAYWNGSTWRVGILN